MASDRPNPESLRLSETETRVLQLYDNLLQLQLELAVVRAQQDVATSPATRLNASDDNQQDLLEAKALLSLRNSVLEGVMMVQPLLEAVHNGTQASPVERDLFPCVEQRDMAAAKSAKQSSHLQEATNKMIKLEVESRGISQQNTLLATDVLQLAAGNQGRRRVENIDDMGLKKEMAEAESELVTSRQRWKVIKGVTSAVVAGSGVDWARDKRLRDMVLDPPDER